MKIKLLCMGAIRDAAISTAISQYTKRIPFYWPFSLVSLPDVRSARTAGPEKQKDLEGKKFLEEIIPGDFVMLLDERGKEYTSRQFSDFIVKKVWSFRNRSSSSSAAPMVSARKCTTEPMP